MSTRMDGKCLVRGTLGKWPCESLIFFARAERMRDFIYNEFNVRSERRGLTGQFFFSLFRPTTEITPYEVS